MLDATKKRVSSAALMDQGLYTVYRQTHITCIQVISHTGGRWVWQKSRNKIFLAAVLNLFSPLNVSTAKEIMARLQDITHLKPVYQSNATGKKWSSGADMALEVSEDRHNYMGG